MAVLEADAAGLPVVGTYHAGIQDVVPHGDTGFWVEEGDIEVMAAYMIRLANDSGLAAALGRRAREHICANFSMDQSIRVLWQTIERAIRTLEH